MKNNTNKHTFCLLSDIINHDVLLPCVFIYTYVGWLAIKKTLYSFISNAFVWSFFLCLRKITLDQTTQRFLFQCLGRTKYMRFLYVQNMWTKGKIFQVCKISFPKFYNMNKKKTNPYDLKIIRNHFFRSEFFQSEQDANEIFYIVQGMTNTRYCSEINVHLLQIVMH